MTYIVSSGALNSTHSLDVGLEVYAVYSVAAVVLKQDNSPTANLKKKIMALLYFICTLNLTITLTLTLSNIGSV